MILSDRDYPKDVVKVGEGVGSEVYIDPKMIVREVLMHQCSKAVLAHSHPMGEARPSKSDIIATIELADHFRAMKLTLLDHLIYSRSAYCCLSDEAEINRSVLYFSKREPVSIFKK